MLFSKPLRFVVGTLVASAVTAKEGSVRMLQDEVLEKVPVQIIDKETGGSEIVSCIREVIDTKFSKGNDGIIKKETTTQIVPGGPKTLLKDEYATKLQGNKIVVELLGCVDINGNPTEPDEIECGQDYAFAIGAAKCGCVTGEDSACKGDGCSAGHVSFTEQGFGKPAYCASDQPPVCCCEVTEEACAAPLN